MNIQVYMCRYIHILKEKNYLEILDMVNLKQSWILNFEMVLKVQLKTSELLLISYKITLRNGIEFSAKEVQRFLRLTVTWLSSLTRSDEGWIKPSLHEHFVCKMNWNDSCHEPGTLSPLYHSELSLGGFSHKDSRVSKHWSLVPMGGALQGIIHIQRHPPILHPWGTEGKGATQPPHLSPAQHLVLLLHPTSPVSSTRVVGWGQATLLVQHLLSTGQTCFCGVQGSERWLGF
jgi:hypothetical protein